MSKITFVNPKTQNNLKYSDGSYFDEVTGEQVAVMSHDIARFVDEKENYAAAFGFQWNKWTNILSDLRGETDNTKLKLLNQRFKLDKFDFSGKTILECGCGGGDDTEILLKFPFTQVCSFDMSNSVDRAYKNIKDDRLTLAQASIYSIPFKDQAFDYVFCHRVVQHTPDPKAALRCIIKKIKPNGHLFIHSYNKSFFYLMRYKYKIRWLTKRLPHLWIYNFVEKYGERIFNFYEGIYKTNNRILKLLAHNFVPFDYIASYGNFNRGQLIELSKLCTFDTLTPAYDKPMSFKTVKRILEEEGLSIVDCINNNRFPVICTAKRIVKT